MLLVATGRAPNVEDVGLETTKAELERGFVKVDARMRTSEPHLYAIGDVVGGLMLAHTAGHEGIVAAHTIAGERTSTRSTTSSSRGRRTAGRRSPRSG